MRSSNDIFHPGGKSYTFSAALSIAVNSSIGSLSAISYLPSRGAMAAEEIAMRSHGRGGAYTGER